MPTKHPFLWFITAVNLVILLIPTAVIFVASFEGGSTVSFPPDSLSLYWYSQIPYQTEFIDAFVRSIQVATISTLVGIPVGTLASYGMIKYDIRWRNPLQIYLLLPFMIPLVVSGIIFTTIFGQLQIYGETWTIGLALTIINLPFMLWSVNSRVNAIDKETENAAKNLGAEELQTFVYVTFPKLLPGIITGALIMFTLGLNEFVVSLLITTRDTVTLPVMLYTAIRSDISPLIAAIASIYILIAIVAVLAVDKVASLEDFLKS
ncbi:ABC transporter permease [Natrialba swarupiae]|uniref:ABC transporter permease n=1 Tax=Natrialba swarupiae TaxID=2448032 RepID=UPI001391E6B0|nr:ABC transporter permease [Natrialba swarupiae]